MPFFMPPLKLAVLLKNTKRDGEIATKDEEMKKGFMWG